MEQHITLNITAKNNYLEVIKEHFPQCFDRFGNFDIEKFKKELQPQEVDFSKESYGLDWLGKSYARLLATDSVTTLIKEDKEWNNKEENKNSQNLLIRGDNLEVLKHLSNAYYKKIKMIYIDPPYNTGDDGFVYQDNRKFTVEEFSKLAGVDEEKAKRILDFVNSSSNSHSAWLTFMYPILYIARQLLRDDGIIFVSIDENEVAQLRILMDEIFGEENFVGDFIRKTKSMTGDKKTGLNIQHESIVCYARNISNIFLEGEEKDFDKYDNPDNDPNGEWVSADPSAKSGGPSLYFEIINPYTGKIDLPPKGRYWAFSKETYTEYVKKGKIKFKTHHKNNERGFIFKRYKNELQSSRNPVNSLEFCNNIYMNQAGTKELRELLNGEYFQNPKPVVLIKKLIYYSTSETDLILDFFAGSGTTGDAVMQLNAEDGGNRRYILVQLPEPIDPKKNKTAYDFVRNELGVENPTIFEITKERLIRAAKKIKEEIIEKKINEKEKEIEEIKARLDIENKEEEISNLKEEINLLKNQDLGFKIFETIPIWEDYDFKAESFENQITFFDAVKLKEEDIQTLLTTWKTYDGVPLTEDLKAVDLDGYIGYYYDTKLYLMFKGFETKHLKKLLEEIDENKEFNPVTIVIFGYNFESKTMREIKENVSSYANKKSINIDVVIRY
ncbi:site-specific DNA-methyltransferase [Marinitoga sp. 38H-ov]|uniref:site-specific DNA-methyltransferase n=1 Tax=Marinitoga sp. 38H-ov TaxID=1755814 RepID=UPI0013EA7320|nr:site-specific DNA-methyltransferase [Marinitoga sp. 38H-ov]KAF2956230.1 DNA methylase [Marinitoga sp. 38H-ov]